MGLVARELEERGIPTVCLVLLREVAEKVRPPRSLVVPFGWGQPLGPPGDDETHEAVITAALRLLEEWGEEPVLEEYRGAGTPPAGSESE